MRIVRLVAGAALGILLASVGCSQRDPGSEAQNGSVKQGVETTNVDSTNQYTYAVGVCLGNPRTSGPGPNGQGCAGTCSGTLVLRNMVITARHCVSQTPEPIDCTKDTFGGASGSPSNFFVSTAYKMVPGAAGWHNVKQVLVPQDDKICGNDIAILVLNDLVPEAEAKLAVPGVQYPMGDTRYSITYTAIGYGLTSPTADNSSGTRRWKENIGLACVPNDVYLGCPGVDLNPKEFAGGDGTCRGDSGSGAFETKSFEKGTAPVSWGVLSRGSDDATHCKGSAYTRLDMWRDFVVEAAAQASNNWQLYAKPNPDWTVYVPPTPKDAGADAAPAPAPTGAGLGETCTVDKDCASQICVDAPDGSRVCSTSCEEGAEGACEEGFTCKEGNCLSDAFFATSPQSTTTTKTTSGCATSPNGSSGSGSVALAGAAVGLALAAGRRRRRT